jgi:hypothetical protein
MIDEYGYNRRLRDCNVCSHIYKLTPQQTKHPQQPHTGLIF